MLACVYKSERRKEDVFIVACVCLKYPLKNKGETTIVCLSAGELGGRETNVGV